MAQDQEERAESGTQGASSATPTWDSYDGEMFPFLSVKEDEKRAGFRVTFLAEKPRRETVNKFNAQNTDFWFDVSYEGEQYTWTISQISLVLELQKHKPLKDKSFDIKLVPVDDDFKKQFPKYKGNDRYEVTPVEAGEKQTIETASADNDKPTVEEQEVKE